MKKLQVAILAAALAAASSARASLEVTIDTPSPSQYVDIAVTGSFTVPTTEVYAGIYNETVNGVFTPSLCIDVYRDVSVNEEFDNYYYLALASSPVTPAGPMGPADAAIIEELWTTYFSAALTDSSGKTAAALQVAVWETLGNGSLGYTVTVSGNDPVTALAATMLANRGTAPAALRGLVSTTGQNYVVPVPEPATMIAGALLLLPFGASTLRILRKNRAA
jgi:hypothetical protein